MLGGTFVGFFAFFITSFLFGYDIT
jgi:hypothetical protein